METIKEINQKMPKMNIKGKDYVQVKDRILALTESFDYEISSDYQYFPAEKLWVVKSTLTIHQDDKVRRYVGMAQEIESNTGVNKTSALENAETSAVGRACAMAGIGVLDSIASIDEINKAENRLTQGNPFPASTPNVPPPEASAGSANGLATVTIRNIYVDPGTTKTGKPYWKMKLDTLERGEMSCFFYEEVHPQYQPGEQIEVMLEQNGKYLNFSPARVH